MIFLRQFIRATILPVAVNILLVSARQATFRQARKMKYPRRAAHLAIFQRPHRAAFPAILRALPIIRPQPHAVISVCLSIFYRFCFVSSPFIKRLRWKVWNRSRRQYAETKNMADCSCQYFRIISFVAFDPNFNTATTNYKVGLIISWNIENFVSFFFQCLISLRFLKRKRKALLTLPVTFEYRNSDSNQRYNMRIIY